MAVAKLSSVGVNLLFTWELAVWSTNPLYSNVPKVKGIDMVP